MPPRAGWPALAGETVGAAIDVAGAVPLVGLAIGCVGATDAHAVSPIVRNASAGTRWRWIIGVVTPLSGRERRAAHA
ncbi:MAG: hypothetical protein NVSMB2_11010 [Chloroflexota bacterium]